MAEIVLPGLCIILFLLFAFHRPITLAFRQLMNGKSTGADEQFSEIVEREKQRIKDEAVDGERGPSPDDAH